MSRKVGVVGLGEMGIGMARNLISSGFSVVGRDLRNERMEMLAALGGIRAATGAEIGAQCDSVFVMVMNGDHVRNALFGEDGVATAMQPGGTVIITSTILPAELEALEPPLSELGIDLVDSPVSGGKAGSESGQLTLMASGKPDVLERSRPAMEAVSKKIFHVGQRPGQGQVVKAALQAMIGCTFAATFESLVMGVNAGVSGKTLYEVFSSSGVCSPLFQSTASHVLNREFEDTGSRIATMHKDLDISLRVAREAGAPMFTTAAALQLFQAGISQFPEGDNWVVAKCLEAIAGTEATWEGN